MSDWGIKVSRAGYPVETAADNQLLFSSSFPSTIVVASGTLANGGTYTHNLGYAPVFFYLVVGSLDVEFFNNSVTVDTTKLYNSSGGTIYYYLIGRDIRTTLSGRNINTTAASQSTINQDYGFKVSQAGYSVETATLAQLVTFSGASAAGQAVRQLLIHQSGYQDNIASGTTVNFSHSLGYVPLFLSFWRKNGTAAYQLEFLDYVVNANYTVTFNLQASSSSSQISITNNEGYAIDFGYVIFKDPF